MLVSVVVMFEAGSKNCEVSWKSWSSTVKWNDIVQQVNDDVCTVQTSSITMISIFIDPILNYMHDVNHMIAHHLHGHDSDENEYNV